MNNREFKSFTELMDLLIRGGEVMIQYKHTPITFLPVFGKDNDKVESVDVAVWKGYKLGQLSDIMIGEERLEDAIPKCKVLFRPDK